MWWGAAGELGIWKSLHSADRNIALYWFCQEKRWSEHCCVLLYSALHPSDQHYITIIKKYFWKIKQFLTNLCDLIKYIIKYNRIWETEKLQLASSYTWQLMRLIQHFCLNVTINYWVFVITNNVDFGEMMRQKYVISNIYVEDTQLQLLCVLKKQCN